METTINQKISPMLWFDSQAEEAAKFYTTVFPNSQINQITRYVKEGSEIHGQAEGTVMTIDFTLDGQRFTALNGGPHFKFNPSISFFAVYETENEVNSIWNYLSDGGTVLMPLDKYDWSEKYGWIQDRFGLSWQVAVGKKSDVGAQSIVSSLLFVKEHHGQAENAMSFYTSVFKNSQIAGVLRYGANELPEKEGTVKHAQFTLENQTFMVMDSGLEHSFTFNEAISFVIHCNTQQEINYYWERLTEGGDPKAQMCGWLKDKFGVSWQVVPTILVKMLKDPDSSKTGQVTKAYMGMKKFNITELEKAYES
jgi:predicted 3-demethylubiquinone-9 3-methyltransferase (glyoxalase superfamily)